MRLKKLTWLTILGVAGCLGSTSLLAQQGPLHIVEVRPDALVVAPLAVPLLDPMPQPNDVIQMVSYFLLSSPENLQGRSVDVWSLEGVYDCAQTNRWRDMGRTGYQVGSGDTVASVPGRRGWATGEDESIEAALWARACQPVATSFVPLEEDLATQEGREKALGDYRSVVPLISDGVSR